MNAEILNQRLADLSPEKRALLQRKLLEKRASAGPQGVRRRAADGPCPLSFGQELMWLLDQLTPGISAYNVPRVLRVRGPLDVDALNRALNELRRRHDILRTNYALRDGQPFQIIAPFAPVTLEVTDLSGLAPAQRESEAMRIAIESSDRGFDLTRDEMLRMGLLRLADQEHILLLISHHIASDGWSKGILFRELETLYKAFRDGAPSPLLDVPLQYADFAVWQRDYLRGPLLDKLLSYWKEQLAGAPPLLELPTDHPRPPVQSGRGRRLGTSFGKDLADALREIGRREGATQFMVGLATFMVLMNRYTGQEDIVVGTPISGRSRTEIENIVGYFSNSLALRASLAGDPSFRELLRQVREVTLEAFSHQEMPFEKLIVELKPARTRSYSPVFQVMFGMGTAQMEELKLDGLEVTTLFTDRGTSKFDLTVGMRNTGDELLAGVEYSTDLFEHSSMERLLGHYRTLLEGIIANPDQRISRLPLLPEAERAQILASGCGPTRPFPLEQCLHQQVEAQVRRTPEAIAVEQNGRRLTYRELNEQANRVAHMLRHAGIGRGEFVVILQERGPDFLAAMLGTFKAGAAYVPVDPNYPRDRVQYLLDRSDARTLLTHYEIIGRFDALLAGCEGLRTLICFDDRPSSFQGTGRNGDVQVYDRGSLERCPVTDVANVNEPSDPLYMIFTSGSTGLPKGAVIRHDGALNHIYAQFDALGLASDFAFLQSAPSCSDISVWQFLAPLVTGGRVAIANETVLLDPHKLFATLRDRRITIAELVPALLQLLTEHADRLPSQERPLPDLRWMMVTGEAAPVGLVNAWLRIYPSIPIVNAYGPTEAADDVLQTVIEHPLPEAQRSAPIGKPLANLRIYIVDKHHQLVPMGVVGEICVGGIGVGVGYWKDPERTEASFVLDPFVGRPGARMYRTGDLGRWLPDGTVEFLGRRDGQVKVRGFRIELGEIESVLRQHPSVKEAVVVLIDGDGNVCPSQNAGGDCQLAAYVVAAEPSLEAATIRDCLRDQLPTHMIPAVFVFLDRLPLTPNGKVDRAALPKAQAAPAESADYVGPRTPLEEAVAEVWAEVLGREQMGIHDDFFETGGHSLLAAALVARLRERFQLELGLRDLFDAPTVAELTRLVFKSLMDRLRARGDDEAAAALEDLHERALARNGTGE